MAYITKAYYGGDEKERPGWWIHFPYDELANERLKDTVPHQDREWDEDNRRWWIAVEYQDQATAIFPNLRSFTDQPKLF